ncbi:MAG: helix-turn-helix transcriptional regulator [Nitrososphaerales archaeon]
MAESTRSSWNDRGALRMAAVDVETDHVAAVAALNEPLRRRIYEHVASAGAEVTREGAADALGVPRSVAAFHLDKLVGAGLLEVESRRPPGRGGPGAGRPAKWYRRAAGERSVSVPERRYELAADLLARAVERAAEGTTGVDDALSKVAREQGRLMARELCTAGRQRSDGEAELPLRRRLADLLARHGYEPRLSDGLIALANCPFHALAAEHRDLVCRMNHQLLCAVAEEAGLPPGVARLDPAPGRCCVTLALL